MTTPPFYRNAGIAIAVLLSSTALVVCAKSTNSNAATQSNPTIPTWTQLGKSPKDSSKGLGSFSVALDAKQNPVVAWAEGPRDSGQSNQVFVSRWDGSNWVKLGDALNVFPDRRAFAPQLVVTPSGDPLVLWTEESWRTPITKNQGYDTFVKRWDGHDWALVGKPPNSALNARPNPLLSSSSAIALDDQGTPIVVHQESRVRAGSEPNDANPSIDSTSVVQRWNGTKWVRLGDLKLKAVYGELNNPLIAIDPRGQPVIAWTRDDARYDLKGVEVRRWDGQVWTILPDPYPALRGASAVLLGLGITNKSGVTIIVRSLEGSGDSASSTVLTQRWNGNGWTTLSPPLKDTVRGPLLSWLEGGATFDEHGEPIVARVRKTLSGRAEVLVQQWRGKTWASLGEPLQQSGSDEILEAHAVSRSGKLVVAYTERINGSYDLIINVIDITR